MTGPLSGERDSNLYTPAFWFVPDPQIWVEILPLTVGPSRWTCTGGTCPHLAPKSGCGQRATRTHDPARFGTNQAIPHRQTVRWSPQRAVFGVAMTPTRAERRLARRSPSAVQRTPFATTWYMTATSHMWYKPPPPCLVCTARIAHHPAGCTQTRLEVRLVRWWAGRVIGGTRRLGR